MQQVKELEVCSGIVSPQYAASQWGPHIGVVLGGGGCGISWTPWLHFGLPQAVSHLLAADGVKLLELHPQRTCDPLHINHSSRAQFSV